MCSVQETELAYAAAMVDGEGSISVGKDKRGNYLVQIVVYNTDARLIDWFNERWPGTVRVHHLGFPRKDGRQINPCYRWRIAGATRCVPFLKVVMPYFMLKRKKAERALAMCLTTTTTGHNYTPEQRAERELIAQMTVN